MKISKTFAKQYKVVASQGQSNKNLVIDITQGAGDRGDTVRIKAQAGVKYQLLEVGKGQNVAPDNVKAKRIGKDLHIIFENDQNADLIIEDYYAVMPDGYNAVIGQAENGNFYEYFPQDPDPKGLITQLTEGEPAVNMALGGSEVLGSGAAVAVFAFNPLLGALGALGAAGVASAAGTGGAAVVVVATTGALAASSDSGAAGDNLTQVNTPAITGRATPGASVKVTVNNVDYTTSGNRTNATAPTNGTGGGQDTQVVIVDTDGGKNQPDGSTNPNTTATVDITSMTTDSGVSGTDYVTNDNLLTYSGTVAGFTANGDKVKVELLAADGTTVIATAYVDVTITTGGNGTWTWPYETTQLQGNYGVRATLVDPAGINGNLNPDSGTNTNDVYRYATINGVQVALPTLNGDITGFNVDSNLLTGTAATVGVSSVPYDEILAIWDTYNGTGTGNSAGTPAGWQSTYWSATISPQTSPMYHYSVSIASGQVYLNMFGAGALTDASSADVALQVVAANAAPVLDAAASPTLTGVSAGAAAPVNGTTTGSDLVSSLVAGITDADSGATKGIAITGVHAGATLYYSTNGGTTWLTATGLSDTNALLLAADSNTRVYYKANGTSGTISDAITFRAWDMTANITEGVYTDTTPRGGKAQFSTASDTVAVTSTVTAGQSVVDLGSSGKLIEPKQVGGDWFYYWDRSGDGTTANSGSANGGVDYTSHNTLDAIFKYDINGVANTTVPNADGAYGTTDVYRYGTINGVFLALPISGSTASGYSPSTAVSLNTTTVNPTYGNSLLGVMDAYNGTVVGGNPAATTPNFWNTGSWWAATPSAGGHYMVSSTMLNGNTDDTSTVYTVLQMVKANTAPVLDAAQSPTLTSVSASAAVPTGVTGDLVSSLVSGAAITDADSGAAKGIAITGVHSGGTLYYSLNGGGTWTQAFALSDTNALLLAADSDTRVFYKANGTSGTISDAITFRAWDQTQNTAEGMYASTVSNGGKAEFSTATDTVGVVASLPMGTTVDLGTVSGVRLNLVNKVTASNGKVYYHVDISGNNLVDGNDGVTHDQLDTLFNGGADTTGASSPTAGVDTERSVIVNGYTLVLPTRAEFAAGLSNTTSWMSLYGWSGMLTYYTADQNGTGGTHWDANNSGSGMIYQSRVDTWITGFAVEVKVPVAPVVLDLNRDGTFSYTQVAMDVDGSNHLSLTQWAGAQDGVLVWDKLGDGVVHDNSQYAFGQYATSTRVDAAGHNRVASDLDGLSDAFDTNHDGVFNAADAQFAEFKVWQDANQNGVSDAGEVRSLADLGIESINLVSDGVQRTPVAGVTEVGQSTAALADGSSMQVADALFAYNPLDYAVSGDSLNLLGADMKLDLSSIVAVHNNVTAVDLTGTGTNTLKLNLNDVLSLPTTNGVHQLTVTGDANDFAQVNLADWLDSGSTVTEHGHTYAVYNGSTDSSAQLLIDQYMIFASHVS
jgi:Bacterial Ig-like domain